VHFNSPKFKERHHHHLIQLVLRERLVRFVENHRKTTHYPPVSWCLEHLIDRMQVLAVNYNKDLALSKKNILQIYVLPVMSERLHRRGLSAIAIAQCCECGWQCFQTIGMTRLECMPNYLQHGYMISRSSRPILVQPLNLHAMRRQSFAIFLVKHI
jgi:hypothetical protein